MITKTDRIRSSLPEHLGFANNVLSIRMSRTCMVLLLSFVHEHMQYRSFIATISRKYSIFSEVVYRLMVRKACAMNLRYLQLQLLGHYRFQYPSLSITGLIM